MPQSGKPTVLNLFTGQKICIFVLQRRLFAPIDLKLGITKRHVGPHDQTKFHANRGYWRPAERFWQPSPKVDPGAFSGQRQGWKTPRGPSGSALLLWVCSGSVLLADLLPVNRSRERDLLSVLSIYPTIFLCIFIVYRRVVKLLCLLLYCALC